MIKLIILDIDGVMTDGRKYYGLDGMPFAKTYCDKDFTAIKRFRAAGITVCFLSGDANVNKDMAANRNIPFYYSRGQNKEDYVSIFEEKYGIHRDDMAYVGDDLFDLGIMKIVGYSYCTKDSPNDLKIVSTMVIDRNGGENVVARLYDLLFAFKLIEDGGMDKVNELDKKEKF